jgi:hypothetical protein
MREKVRKTAELGELIVAAFDIAAQYSADHREISHLATRAVMEIVRRVWQGSPCPPTATTCNEVSAVA